MNEDELVVDQQRAANHLGSEVARHQPVRGIGSFGFDSRRLHHLLSTCTAVASGSSWRDLSPYEGPSCSEARRQIDRFPRETAEKDQVEAAGKKTASLTRTSGAGRLGGAPVLQPALLRRSWAECPDSAWRHRGIMRASRHCRASAGLPTRADQRDQRGRDE